jgi:hypothetical protein
MTVLLPHQCEHLAKLLGMLGSDHDGERASAGLKADTYVRSLGLTWHEILVPESRQPEAVREMIGFALLYFDALSFSEQEFLRTISSPDYLLSPRQAWWLQQIVAKLKRAGAAA